MHEYAIVRYLVQAKIVIKQNVWAYLQACRTAMPPKTTAPNQTAVGHTPVSGNCYLTENGYTVYMLLES